MKRQKYTVKGDGSDSGGLNSIMNRYGFKNYKQAGVSSVPSGDFNSIKEGDVIEFNQNQPNKEEGAVNVEGFNTNTPVYLNTKGKQQNQKNNFDDLNGLKNKSLEEVKVDRNKIDKVDKTQFDKEYDIYNTDDSLLGRFNTWEVDQKRQAVDWEEKQRKSYDNIFSTLEGNISQEKVSALKRIDSIFNKRIDEQLRINKSNTDRVKAYGLSGEGGSALYTPLMFTDAVSRREEEGAEKIAQIGQELENAISEAENAYRQGDVKLMRERLDAHSQLKVDLNNQIDDIEKESDRQYKAIRKVREEKEAQVQAQRQSSLDSLALTLQPKASQFAGLSPDDLYKQADLISKQSGLEFTDVLSAINQAIAGGFKQSEAKSKADLAKERVKTQKASTSKKWWDIKNVKDTIFKRKDNTKAGGNGFIDPNDYDNTEEGRRKFISAGGESKDYDDNYNVGYQDKYGDDPNKRIYRDGKQTSKDLKTVVANAGYDYNQLLKDGYSVEDIKETFNLK